MGRKRLKQYVLIFIAVLVAISLVPFFLFNKISAQTNTNGLTVSPIRNEIYILPGTMQPGKIDIKNSYDFPIDIKLSAEEFNVINQNYDYVFTEDSDVIKWVSFKESTINLEAGETISVEYYIGVPNNAEPGGRYISLFVTSDIKGEDQISRSEQRVASLIYLEVEGDVSRIGDLVSFRAPWLTTGSGGWSATVRNSGTTHYHSHYSVVLYDLFGSKKWEFSGESLVLPASIRLITGKIPDSKFPGVYRVIYKISLGDSPGVEKRSFLVYIPIWFLSTLTILGMGFFGIKYYKKTKNQ